MNKKVFPLSKISKALLLAVLIIFIILSIWYLAIHSIDVSQTLRMRQAWGSTYQIMAIFGGIIGLLVSYEWGGYKSLFGKAILFFSIGLLLQSFGQTVDSYYNFFMNASIPYPSIGDFGFMGSVLAYITGTVFLMKATGYKYSLQTVKGKAIAIVIPLAILILSYLFYLQGYQFDWSNTLKIFLDFSYPLGQAVYVSLALLAYLLSRKYLGGILKTPIILLIIALIVQYFSDFTFLYQANSNTWSVGGLNDFLYFLSYTLMTISLIYTGEMFFRLKEFNKQIKN